MNNYPAKEFLKFKKKELNLAPLGQVEKKKCICNECGEPSDKIVKGDCYKCYNRKAGRRKAQKRNEFF